MHRNRYDKYGPPRIQDYNWYEGSTNPFRDRYTPEPPRPQRAQAPPHPPPNLQTQPPPRRLDARNRKDDAFPVTRSRLNKWRDEVEKVEQICLVIQGLGMPSRDRKLMKKCVDEIKRTTKKLDEELKERMKGERLRGLGLVRG